MMLLGFLLGVGATIAVMFAVGGIQITIKAGRDGVSVEKEDLR